MGVGWVKGYLAKFTARTVSKHCVHKAEKCFRRADLVRRLSRGLDDGPGESQKEHCRHSRSTAQQMQWPPKTGAEEPTLAA